MSQQFYFRAGMNAAKELAQSSQAFGVSSLLLFPKKGLQIETQRA